MCKFKLIKIFSLILLILIIGCDERGESESDNISLDDTNQEKNFCVETFNKAATLQINGNYKRAAAYYEAGFDKCEGRAFAYFQYGVCKYFIGEYDQATVFMNKAVTFSREQGKEDQANSYEREIQFWHKLRKSRK